MSEPIRGRTIDFADTLRLSVRARKHVGEIEYYDKGKFPGVHFKDWKFKDIDASERDGALIEIDPGARTPVQLVEADKVISDVPLTGMLTFLHMDLEGNICIYRFDSGRSKDNSFQFDIGKGEIMCWFASAKQDKPAELMEYEEPGYSSSDFTNIEPRTSEVSGRKIPSLFWEIVEALQNGEIRGVSLPIVDLDTLK